MLLYLVITQVFYLLGLVLWPFVSIMSVMAFDSGMHAWSVTLFAFIVSYPLFAIGCSVTAWILRRRRSRAAVAINAIPALWVVGLPCAILISQLVFR